MEAIAPDLLTDLRVPKWLRDQMRSVSIEAECLAALGVDPHEDTQAGRRFAYLYREAERCANAAVPYVYGNAAPEPEASANTYFNIHETVGRRAGNTGLVLLVLGGIIAITCCGALIII